MTLVSESCSLAVVTSHSLPILLQLITSSNRSDASLHVVKTTVRLLANVSKVVIFDDCITWTAV